MKKNIVPKLITSKNCPKNIISSFMVILLWKYNVVKKTA